MLISPNTGMLSFMRILGPTLALALFGACTYIEADEARTVGDRDGDGFASDLVGGADCDDTDPGVHPDAQEWCNGIDDDCNGSIDVDAEDGTTWYADIDGDGFGTQSNTTVTCTQAPPSGFRSNGDDCDDFDVNVNPHATDVCNDQDDNCDGTVDEDAPIWFPDHDQDGFGDPNHPTPACTAPDGYLAHATDCDDLQSSVHPNATESCNLVDDNCDGTVDEAPIDGQWFYLDADDDGYGDEDISVLACEQPPMHRLSAGDCDDTQGSTHPDAPEICNDAVDNDCDGLPGDCVLDGHTELQSMDANAIWGDGGDTLGWVVRTGGDYNGDGIGDLAIGVPGAVAGDLEDVGRIDLYFGPLQPGTGPPSATVVGASPGQGIGRTFINAGDVDGDGFGDLIVGSSTAVSRGPGSGSVWLIFGASGTSAGPQSVQDATLRIDGYVGSAFGTALSAPGDVNGDGINDIVVGYGGGEVAVFSTGLRGEISAETSGIVITGCGGTGTSGSYVDGADLNGDGMADVVLGTPEDDDFGNGFGSASLFYGPIVASIDLTEADAHWTASQSAMLGSEVKTIDDMDGDGNPDVALLAPHIASVYVVSGASQSGSNDVTDQAIATLYDDDITHWASGHATPGGDNNRDGSADLLIGAWEHHWDAAWLVLGPISGQMPLSDQPRFSRNNGDHCGGGISAADLNDDGWTDVVVACPRATNLTGGLAGAVWMIPGIGL